MSPPRTELPANYRAIVARFVEAEWPYAEWDAHLDEHGVVQVSIKPRIENVSISFSIDLSADA